VLLRKFHLASEDIEFIVLHNDFYCVSLMIWMNEFMVSLPLNLQSFCCQSHLVFARNLLTVLCSFVMLLLTGSVVQMESHTGELICRCSSLLSALQLEFEYISSGPMLLRGI
jgi:hypothetical protein